MSHRESPSLTRPSARPARRAFTLAEMLVAIALSSLLLLGLSTTIFIAASTIPDPKSDPQASIRAGEILNRLSTELETAVYVTELTATTVGFTVPDRDGDGFPERIRYAWSGTPGDPLIRQYNAGSPTALAPQVDRFDLAPVSTSVAESYPGPATEDPNESLLVDDFTTSGLGNADVQPLVWKGQYFSPTLPSGVYAWRPTRVQFMAKRNSVPGVTLVQLRPSTATFTPTGEVLEQSTLTDASLSTSYAWQSFSFSRQTPVAAGGSICFVLQDQTGSKSATVQTGSAGPGLLTTNTAGVWSYDNSKSLVCQLYGKLFASSSSRYVNSTYLVSMTVRLQLSGMGPLLSPTVAMMNHPELLSGLWELKFDRDPTRVDVNGDGQGDWLVEGGGNFDAGSLAGGAWTTSGSVLRTSPARNFDKTTVLDLRFQAATAGGKGAAFSLPALENGSTCAPIEGWLALQSDGTQTLSISEKIDSLTSIVVVRVPGLPGGLVDLHAILDPASPAISVAVNGVQRGTFPLTPVSSSGSGGTASLGASGCTAKFVYARIRILP